MEYLLAAIKLAPLIVQAGMDITAYVEEITAVNHTDPTQADWDNLKAREDAARAIIDNAIAADK